MHNSNKHQLFTITMNSPYMCPCDAPWTPEYQESHPRFDDDDHSRYWCDETEDEYLDSLYGVV
jgi:hypothetical protein